ncbi:MAG: GGDEF domain-containing protein [Treponemataceae bacterium]
MHESVDIMSDPRLLKHYSLLQDLGILSYVDSLRRETRDYESLLSGTSEIFKRTSIDEMIETTVRCITDRFLPSFLVFVWRPRSGHDDLVLKSFRNLKQVDTSLKLESITPFEPFFRKYPGPISYELFEYQIGDEALTSPFKAVSPEIVVPVVGLSGLYGLILIGAKVLEEQYSARELSYLDKLMASLAISIQNHLHYEHSVRDVKTGLFNHGFFMVRLHEEVARGKRNGYTFSVIVLDVDKFKTFNDSFGHLAGDRVLESIAETLNKNVRDLDVLARFGGEEFTVLLPETNREQAWTVSERLRESVEQLQIEWPQKLPRVTISAGVAVFRSEENLEASQLLSRADEALYSSKERGRNRTTIWGAGLLFRTRLLQPKTE